MAPREEPTMEATERDHAILKEAVFRIGSELSLCSAGRKTVNTDPWRFPLPLLRARMLPPCFCTIPRVTHRPRPLPVLGLVVKNGSKILYNKEGGIPWPS